MNHSNKHKIIDYSTLTIDVEDGINIWMRDLFNMNFLPTERVIKNVNVILELLSNHNTKATFFVLGEVASSFPSLVRSISLNGHEIGVHGYYHDQIFKLSYKKAMEDIYRAKSLIEEITGTQVYGYRAPAFSIVEETKWCLELLSNLGFTYDSSIMPAKGKRYGWPSINKGIHRFRLPSGNKLIEVPLSVINVCGKTIPACGGGYLRYFPYSFTRQAFIQIEKKYPVIVYMHPYEIDEERYPDYFYEAKAKLSLMKRLPLSLYRVNKGTVRHKLENLLKEFTFKPTIELINDLNNNSLISEINLR